MNDTAAEVLFVGEEFFPVIAQIRTELRTVRRIVALSGCHPEWETYVASRDRQDRTDPALPIRGDDVALQLYTSGTTGHPRGALITHDNLFAALGVAPEWYPCTAEDVSLICLPQYRIGGSFVGLLGVHAGARAVIPREPALAVLLRLIETERVTSPHRPRPHRPEAEVRALHPRVLVVEDESPIRDLVTDFLEAEGFGLEVAASVEEAELRIAEEHPDLILLDLRLPGRSGWDFLRQRHDDPRLAAIPVLVLSAAPEDRLLEAKELGADAFLSKPFDLDILSALVRSYAH